MDEFGVFTDEGMVVGDFYSREEAEKWMAANCSPEDGAHVAEVCPVREHEAERETCEACATSEEG